MLLTILIGIIIICSIILWASYSPFYWKRKGIPYLFPLPIFGNSLSSFRLSLADYYVRLYNNFPNDKYYGFHFFTRPTLLLKDYNLLKDICIKDFEYFTSSGYYTNEANDPAGGNLLFIHGERWKEIRSKLSNHFTPSKLRTINEYVENAMDGANKCITEKMNNKQPIKIEQLTVSIAVDVIMQAVFGIETDCFQNNSQFYDFAERIFSLGTNLRVLISLISPKTNDFFKIKLIAEDKINFLANILKDVIKYRENNNVTKPDFVNAMMNLMKSDKGNDDQEQYFSDSTKVPVYNFKTVLAQALILMTGGMESAAVTMAFFLYEASLNQGIQGKCREEIMSIITDTGTDIRVEDINRLVYLDTALTEALRKYPPFIILPRECTKSYTVKDTNFTIDPGTLILAPIKSIQWDPKYYPNPEAFIPERFSTENRTANDTAPFLTWGLGPRTCLGKSFAKIEMFLVVSRLLRRYRFTLSPRTKVPVDIHPYKPITTPKTGIWLDVQPINI